MSLPHPPQATVYFHSFLSWLNTFTTSNKQKEPKEQEDIIEVFTNIEL